MLVYYATLRQFMRIPMGVFMRATQGIKKSVNVSLAPEILEEARRLKLNLSAVLTAALQEQVRRPFNLIYDPDDEWVLIRVQLPNGVLDVQALEKRLFSSSSYILLIWMVAASSVLLLVAVIFLRNQIRPIRKLAIAAERFGRGQDMPTFKPEGAREVRAAATAFLDMHDRIKRQIAQRTAMLAGISHDLRTPLTRMRLGLSILPQSPDIQGLEEDIADMEKMVNGYLEFVRGEGDETTVAYKLPQLLGEIYQRAQRANMALTIHDPIPDITLMVRPQAISRALMNLVVNGAKYAGNMDMYAYQPDDTHVALVLDDDGPGIAPELHEDVFRPFFRGEPSRNKSTGGIGLGLSITRDIIMAHGGKVTLDRNSQGGLRVIVLLPV